MVGRTLVEEATEEAETEVATVVATVVAKAVERETVARVMVNTATTNKRRKGPRRLPTPSGIRPGFAVPTRRASAQRLRMDRPAATANTYAEES